MAAAYAAHPERFIRAIPQPPALPTAVWINPPAAILRPRATDLKVGHRPSRSWSTARKYSNPTGAQRQHDPPSVSDLPERPPSASLLAVTGNVCPVAGRNVVM